jgi:TPR repeat protein
VILRFLQNLFDRLGFIGVAGTTYNDAEAAMDAGRYWRARGILQPLAETGDPRAQFDLGGMYMMGQGVARDETKGTDWILKAANQGLADAELAIGSMYLLGEGFQRDTELAVEWLGRAAEDGQIEAQFLLGDKYLKGEEVKKDPAAAARLFRMAAEQGHPRAQNNLAMMHDEGNGVERSRGARTCNRAVQLGLNV